MTRIAAAVGAALCALVALAPAAAGAGSTSGTGASVILASQTPWVKPGNEFVLRLQVVGVRDPTAVELVVAVHQRVKSRSQFALTEKGQLLGSTVRTTSARLADLFPTDAAGAVTVRLDPTKVGATDTGLYPVEVTLRDRLDGSTLDHLVTYMLRVPEVAPGPRLSLALVVRAHARPALRPTGARQLPATARLATLAAALDSPAYRGIPLVIAPTPETLDALADAGDERSRSTLDALRDALHGRQLAAGTYVPVDLPGLVGSGLADEVAAQLSRGSDTVARLLHVRPDARTWVGDEDLDEAATAHLRDIQVDRVIVPDADLVPVARAVTPEQPFVLEGRLGRRQLAAAADSALAAHFHADGDQVLAANQLLADLAVLWLDAPGQTRGVVAVTPRNWSPSPAFLDALLDGISASPVVVPTTFDGLFGAVPTATGRSGAPLVRRVFDTVPSSSRDRTRSSRSTRSQTTSAIVPVGRVRDLRQQIDALASTLPATSAAFDELDERMLVAESVDARADQSAYLAAVQRAVDRQMSAVALPRGGTVTLTAREGEIPLTLLNRTSEPVTVVVQVKSDKLDFPQAARRRVQLLPRSTTLRFAVRARTSGAFPLQVTLRAPQGNLVLASTRFTVRSTAASGVGVFLSVGAAVFLLAWWGTHLHRGRRDRRLVPQPAA